MERNIYSRRWGWITTGSGHQWVWSIPREVCFCAPRSGEDRLSLPARWHVGRTTDCVERLGQTIAGPFHHAEEGFKYGFKWWLLPRTDRQGYVWMARGFGGQRLMVFPEENLIVVFTGWEILKDPAGDRELVSRILPAVRAQSCTAMP